MSELREMLTSQDLKIAFEVLKELRTKLEFAEFIALYDKARNTNQYTIVGCFNDGQCVGVMGYRILFDFVHGPHLYIDDLVRVKNTDPKDTGKNFCNMRRKKARELELKGLRLCTGIDNDSAKRFYEREGWAFRSVVYKKAFQQ